MVSTTPRRGRPPGRPPAQPDGPDQRERLVNLALQLYGRKGYAATTLAAIAREAGMTPAAVHYYFKTREQLFDIVFDEYIVPMRRRIDEVFESNAHDPARAFSRLAERFVELAAEKPWIGPVFFGDLLSENDLFKKHMKQRMDSNRHISLVARVRAWQAEGKLNADLDPTLLITSILSLTILPMTAMRRWKDDPLRQHLTPDVITRHAVALLKQGLAPAT